MKWLYENNVDNTARFTLGEYATVSDRTLICVGINPSIASSNNLDQTLRKVKAMAIAHGYINWNMINVYPQRATNPINLHLSCDLQLHAENLNKIKELLLMFSNSDILFAYGNLITLRPYLQKCLSDIIELISDTNFSGQYYCLRQTKKGYPTHPLYQKIDTPFLSYKHSV